MRLIRTELEHFKTFRGKHTFEFPKKPGLYQLSGLNRVAPHLGGNATGKSSFWDAVYWCNYGKTVRGVKAGNVINWDESSCWVANTYERDDGEQFQVRRTQNPNSLVLCCRREDRSVTQDEVDAQLDCGATTFLHGVLIGQFGTTFMDLTPADKLACLTDILDLEVWVEASKLAKAKWNNATLTKQTNWDRVQRVKGQIEATDQSITTELDREGREKQAAARRVKDAREGLASAEARLDESRKDAAALADLAAEKILVTKDCRKARQDAERDHHDATEAHKKVAIQLQGLTTEKSGYAERSREIESTYPKCPVCGQEVTRAHLKTEIDKLTSKLSGVEEARRVIDKRLGSLAQAMNVAAKAAQDARKREDGASVASNKASQTHVAAQGEEQRAADALEAAKRSLSVAAAPVSSGVPALQKQRENLVEELERWETGFKTAEVTESRLEYWITGFKDIRLWIVNRALRQFEAVTNASLMQLGLRGWSIKMDVERETKAGTLSRGFSVLIQAPGAAEDVPWESWSGGETQRLRLAGAMGLMTLIADRTATRLGLEVWDEPLQHMSQAGIDDFIEFVSERAKAEKKCIWVVEHHVLDSGFFDGGFVVARDKGGSRVCFGEV